MDTVVLVPMHAYNSTEETSYILVSNNASETVKSDYADVTLMALSFAVLMSICILSTIVGNVLVVLSVFTYKPLRGVQNFYIISLACADLAVAIFVMPFHVANSVVGYWQFGAVFCNMWLTSDVFTCTASILNLCAIAVDRYYAIHDPINYAQKRTLVRVLIGILIVWLASAIISIPPLFGWNNSSQNSTSLYNAVNRTCQLTDEQGYVLYSASGSFYIPLILMAFLYVNIFIATRARLRARAGHGMMGSVSVSARTHASVSEMKRHGASYTNHSPSVAQTQSPPLEGNGGIESATKDGSLKIGSNGVGNGDQSDMCATPDSPRTLFDTPTDFPQSANVPSNTSNKSSPRPRFIESFIRFSGRSNNSSAETGVRLVSGMDNRRFNARRKNPTDSSPESSVKGSQMSQFLEEKQRISLSKERRAARTMGIIMGAFVLCWLPFFLMYVIFPFCRSCKENTDPRISNFIVWLGYINSTLNPIIYTVFNIDFRRAFKSLLQCNSRFSVATEMTHLLTNRASTVRNRTT